MLVCTRKEAHALIQINISLLVCLCATSICNDDMHIYVYTRTQLAANTIRRDAFHICASQSPTTKFALLPSAATHKWTLCGRRGRPLRPLPRPSGAGIDYEIAPDKANERPPRRAWPVVLPCSPARQCWLLFRLYRLMLYPSRAHARNETSAARHFTKVHLACLPPCPDRVLHRTVFLSLTEV